MAVNLRKKKSCGKVNPPTMPHGKSRKSTRRRRGSVKFVRPPPAKKTTSNYVRKNALAVNKLSKQVKSLQYSQYGCMQSGFQRMTNHVVPIARSPVLFDMLDFSVNHLDNSTPPVNIASGPFYQINGGQLQAVAHWQLGQISSAFWQGENTDTVDTGSYLACWMDYTFHILGNSDLDNTRVRIDIFQQRSRVLYDRPPGVAALTLPSALGQLDNIALPHLNQLNPRYFKKIKTIVKYFNSRTDAGQRVTQFTPNDYYVKYRAAPMKLRQQVITNPAVGALDQADLPDGQFGHFQTPVNQQLWCLISTDDLSALTGDQVNVTISRKLRWRDRIGSGGLSGRV